MMPTEMNDLEHESNSLVMEISSGINQTVLIKNYLKTHPLGSILEEVINMRDRIFKIHLNSGQMTVISQRIKGYMIRVEEYFAETMDSPKDGTVECQIFMYLMFILTQMHQNVIQIQDLLKRRIEGTYETFTLACLKIRDESDEEEDKEALMGSPVSSPTSPLTFESEISTFEPAITPKAKPPRMQRDNRKTATRRPNHPSHISKVLKEWLYSNLKDPYPEETVKVALCQETGLTLTQLNNWFINARRRYIPEFRRKRTKAEN